MTCVLLIGYDPAFVDFSDPSLPPGLTPDIIHAGVEATLRDFKERGWQVEHCSVRPDESAGPAVARALSGKRFDCVVIGGGVRLSRDHVEIFETIVNTVMTRSQGTPIGFNTRPENSAAAVLRCISRDAAS